MDKKSQLKHQNLHLYPGIIGDKMNKKRLEILGNITVISAVVSFLWIMFRNIGALSVEIDSPLTIAVYSVFLISSATLIYIFLSLRRIELKK